MPLPWYCDSAFILPVGVAPFAGKGAMRSTPASVLLTLRYR